jgi:hypothetical protein
MSLSASRFRRLDALVGLRETFVRIDSILSSFWPGNGHVATHAVVLYPKNQSGEAFDFGAARRGEGRSHAETASPPMPG